MDAGSSPNFCLAERWHSIVLDLADKRHFVVIGGGITGLAASLRLSTLAPETRLTFLEAGERLGGVLQTVERDGFLIERGADNFITTAPSALELCNQVGLADSDLLSTDERLRQAFVVRHGRLHPIPAGFLLMVPGRIWPLLASGVLSPWGKLRALAEYFVPPRTEPGDESLASFARRRLGREAFERLVQPLVGGIYTADAEKLSLAATMPRFLEMERTWGGLIRAHRHGAGQAGVDAASSGTRYSMFMTPRAGLSSLVAACAARLPAGSIRLQSRVTSLERSGEGWRVITAGPDGRSESLEADGVILALPAPAAGRLLQTVQLDLAGELDRIAYAGAAVVSLGYRREQITHPLSGFGFVVPEIEQRSILAASFSSLKFPGRAPAGHVLVRVFIGGACHPELAGRDDAELTEMARRELSSLLGARGQPVVCDIARWPTSMAQYHLGHIERIERIERLVAVVPGLALAGNAYHGVGISQCIISGRQAAERVLAAHAHDSAHRADATLRQIGRGLVPNQRHDQAGR